MLYWAIAALLEDLSCQDPAFPSKLPQFQPLLLLFFFVSQYSQLFLVISSWQLAYIVGFQFQLCLSYQRALCPAQTTLQLLCVALCAFCVSGLEYLIMFCYGVCCFLNVVDILLNTEVKTFLRWCIKCQYLQFYVLFLIVWCFYQTAKISPQPSSFAGASYLCLFKYILVLLFVFSAKLDSLFIFWYLCVGISSPLRAHVLPLGPN